MVPGGWTATLYIGVPWLWCVGVVSGREVMITGVTRTSAERAWTGTAM